MFRRFEFHAGVLHGAAILAALLGVPAPAQSIATGAAPVLTPRVEIFAGYSYLYPNATASGLLSGGIVPVTSCLCAITKGAGASVTYDFNHWLGLTLDTSAHIGGKSGTPAQRIGNSDAYNLSIGPQFKLRYHRLSPFAEALVGGDRLAPSLFHQDTGFGLVAGGGLDLALGHRFSARLLQADFVYANHSFSPSPSLLSAEPHPSWPRQSSRRSNLRLPLRPRRRWSSSRSPPQPIRPAWSRANPPPSPQWASAP